MEEIREIISKIVKLGMKINEIEGVDVFIDFSGHANLFEISIHPNGWQRDNEIKSEIRIKPYRETEDLDYFINKTKDKLNIVLKNLRYISKYKNFDKLDEIGYREYKKVLDK